MIVNLYATVRELPELAFDHEPINARDLTDPELAEHLIGFIGFVTQGIERMTQTRYAVVRHIERVQHQVSVDVEPTALPGIAAWATRANAIMFLPDGSVRDPFGRVLVEPGSQEYDPRAGVPYMADAQERKRRSQERLSSLGLSPHEGLPPVQGEAEVVLRSVVDVARRAQALLSVASYALGLLEEDPWQPGAIDEAFPLAREAWSPLERELMEGPAPTRDALVPWVWRYESAWALLWALGEAPELGMPSAIVDMEVLREVAAPMRSGLAWFESLGLRSDAGILDMLDIHLRAHWVMVQARVEGGEVEGWDAGVVLERHLALNWLTGFEGASWDEVGAPT